MGTHLLKISDNIGINTTVVSFSKPVNNGIYLLSSNSVLMNYHPPYYGDEVDMFFWKRLNVVLGDFQPSTTLFHLQVGYKYKYYHDKKLFKVYNEVDKLIYTKTINKLAETGIDFDIYKSHQFMIYTDGTGAKRDYFYLNGLKMLKRLNTLKITNPTTLTESGIINELPVTDHLFDLLGQVPIIFTYNWSRFVVSNDEANNYAGINKYDIFNSPIAKYPYYTDGMNISRGLATRKLLQGNKLQLDMLVLPLLALSMFPALLPVENEGETVNNRPVYEPFMIWGYFKFLNNKVSFDDLDKFMADVFSISPNWG